MLKPCGDLTERDLTLPPTLPPPGISLTNPHQRSQGSVGGRPGRTPIVSGRLFIPPPPTAPPLGRRPLRFPTALPINAPPRQRAVPIDRWPSTRRGDLVEAVGLGAGGGGGFASLKLPLPSQQVFMSVPPSLGWVVWGGVVVPAFLTQELL